MKNKIILALTCLFSVLFLFFIFKLSDEIQRKEEILESSPDVTDVTQKIKTLALVTDKDLSPESWASQTLNEAGWKTVKIPEYQMVQENDFKVGNFGYYRIFVPAEVTMEFAKFKGQLELSPQYVLFKHVEVFVNGRFVRSNSPVTGSQAILNIPIEAGRDNIISIKGTISKGDSGIKHRGKIFLGKASALNELHVSAYKGNYVFPLLFILSKGSVIFVFALIYLLLNVERFFEKSLLFSLCAVGEDVLTGDFLSALLTMNTRVYIYNLLNIGANFFLFMFLADVVGRNPDRKRLYVITAIISVISYAIAVDILHASYLFSFNNFLQFWNYISAAVILYYLPQVIKRDKVLFLVMVIVLTLNLWNTISGSNAGLNFKMMGNLILFFMVAYQSFALFRREQLDREAKTIQLLEQEKDVAIGKTASLLAHDVRRPLEQMKLILDKVTSGEIGAEFINAAKRDVDFSITSVNNQINDIMNYSKTRPVVLNDISFYRVLSGSLKQVMTINKNMNLDIQLNFQAHTKILGDESRLASALTNLVSNAVEAIRDIGKKDSGTIRLSTRLENKKFIFSIFNDGPVIPESMLQDIWRPLFTSGKESGTGLGLSSVLKTVQDHQGEISVKNIGQNGVEFELKLEASLDSDNFRDYEFHQDSRSYTYETKSSPQGHARPIRIFLLDDDAQVHEYFQFLVRNLPFDVDLTFVSHYETARDAIRAKRHDLYILDFDLGGQKTGLDFYQENLSFLKSEVVIHSNRDLGKELLCQHLKKPMTYDELHSLCEKAYERRVKVLLVDDSELTLMAWEMFHGKHNIQVANSPEAALALLQQGDIPVDLCVVDYYYDNSRMTGETLALKIKALQDSLRVVLASNSDLSVAGFQSIDKNHFEVRSLI